MERPETHASPLIMPPQYLLIASFIHAAIMIGCGTPSSPDEPIVTDAGLTDAGLTDAGLTDAGLTDVSGDVATKSATYIVVGLDNELCDPQPLPTVGGTRMANCRILLENVGGGCDRSGLSAATPLDVSAVQTKSSNAGLSLSSLCQLPQLATSASVGDGCANDAELGWCYSLGSCSRDAGNSCHQSICTTGAVGKFGGGKVSYAASWLACP